MGWKQTAYFIAATIVRKIRASRLSETGCKAVNVVTGFSPGQHRFKSPRAECFMDLSQFASKCIWIVFSVLEAVGLPGNKFARVQAGGGEPSEKRLMGD
jgi:hypothetical protein